MSMQNAAPNGARRKFAAFCTAVLATAALALLPAIPAAADATDDLMIAAQEARAAADAAHGAAAQAEADAANATAAAAEARAAADVAQAAFVAATDALALDPDNVDLQAAAAAAEAAALEAAAIADSAEALAAEAAAAAAAALANAADLEAAALAAEEAYAATQETEEIVETEEVTQELQLFSNKNYNNDCDNFSSFNQEQALNFDWCLPDPDIKIKVKNICPTVVKVEIEDLWFADWFDYTVKVNGSWQEITVDKWGNAYFEVTDFTHGKFEVKVYRDGDKVADDDKWIDYNKCPEISTEIEHECKVIGGEAEVEVRVSKLEWWRSYDINVSGPGYDEDFNAQWDSYWEEDLYLAPGTYTVTVTSDGNRDYPDLGPVTYEFVVDPCPGEVVITIHPVCSTNGSGSLGASLSGLVSGREYHVTVTGPNGVVTDVTFVADSPNWAVPPANLPPGSYTVTVVDTESHDGGGYTVLNDKKDYEHTPLTWTATGTITPCPALASTGTGPSSELMPALALLPLGAGLVIASAVRRRPLAEVEEE